MKGIFLYILVLLSLAAIAQEDTASILLQVEKTSQMDSKQAVATLEDLIDQSDQMKFLQGSITGRKKLAQLYLLIDEQYDGLRSYFQLIHLLEKNNRYEDLVAVNQELSKYYETYGLFLSSAQYLEKNIAIADSHRIEIDHFHAYLRLGDLYFQALEFNIAQGNYEQALDIALETNSSNKSIKARRRIVRALEKQQDYQSCLENNLLILDDLERLDHQKEIPAQLNNIGYNQKRLGNNNEALDYFKKTLKIREQQGFKDNSHISLLINIAITLQNVDRQPEAIAFLNRALDATEKDDITSKVKIHNLKSIALLSEGAPYDALLENDKALRLTEDKKMMKKKRDLYQTRSLIYEALLEYDLALDSYKHFLELNDSITLDQTISEQNLLQQQIAVEKTEKEIQNLIAENDIKDYQLEQLELESENKDIQLRNQELQAKEKLQDLKIRQQELENKNKEKELQAIKAREENQRLLIKQKELEEEKQKQEIALLETKTKVQDLEIQKTRSANRSMIVISLLALIIMIVALLAFFGIRKRNKAVKFEKAKSEKLLLNILPEATAEELKTLGKSMPRNYNSVTILFTDFKGFTMLTEDLHPEELVENLDAFFVGFDDIMNKYGIEKIKTIGDAYMCACGVPEPIDDHPIRMVKAAQEMLRHAAQINKLKIEKGLPVWDLRIGINTGSVVAGVIGKNKFQYDIWGDAVNLAARMESSGAPNRINLSESTFQKVKDDIPCTFRGELEAKNKGKVKMYFVD